MAQRETIPPRRKYKFTNDGKQHEILVDYEQNFLEGSGEDPHRVQFYCPAPHHEIEDGWFFQILVYNDITGSMRKDFYTQQIKFEVYIIDT